MFTQTPENKHVSISFSGQHAFQGGFSSCSFNAALAAHYFINLDSATFFKKFGLDMDAAQIKEAAAILSDISQQGNLLNLEYNYQGTNLMAGLFHRLYPKEISNVLSKIQTMNHLDQLKDLKLLDSDNSENPFKNFCPTLFNRYKNTLTQDAFAFLSCAAYHYTMFLIKTNPTNNKSLYCIYDSSPSSVLGTKKNEGIFEIHATEEAAFERLKLRWKSDKDATIHAFTTKTRIQVLMQEVTKGKELK